MKKLFKIKLPKFKIELINNWNKYDWHINVIPYLNFGNDEWNSKAVVINSGWLVWNIYIYLNFKKNENR